MPQLFCIVDEGGRTLLVKTQGDIQTPSFPTVGLLCSISTYSETAGFAVDTFGTENVQIVYRRFNNHLMFMLATSNLLLQAPMLQTLLQAVYDGIQMLVGPAILQLGDAGKIDALRRKIRGLPLIDHLIDQDGLVPCLMLSGPQVLGLPLREKAALHAALTRVAEAAGAVHAALLADGLYLAATPEWWRLATGEALLIQHIATHVEPEASIVDIPLFLTGRPPLRLTGVMMDRGMQLLLLSRDSVDVVELQPVMERALRRVEGVTRVPIWAMPAVPQFAGLTFDMAAVVAQSPSPCVTLFWGRSGEVPPPGISPLMSPTLRRQLQNSPSGGLASLRSISLPTGGQAGADSAQVCFKACLDLVVAFMLQCGGRAAAASELAAQQAQGRDAMAAAAAASTADGGTDNSSPPTSGLDATSMSTGLGAAASGRPPAALPTNAMQPATPTGGQSAAARLFSSFVSLAGSLSVGAAAGMGPRPALDEEVHLTGPSGTRLVGILDRGPTGVGLSVFLATSAAVGRREASETARKLRGVFNMSYTAETE